jgi:membrane-bound ClpP family serine protease
MDLTQMEQGAAGNFLASPGPLKAALEKFVSHMAQEHKAMCAAAMSTVPRNTELAADHAAKAQLLDEFWITLADVLAQAQVTVL